MITWKKASVHYFEQGDKYLYGGIININKTCQQLTGRSVEEMKGRNIIEEFLYLCRRVLCARVLLYYLNVCMYILTIHLKRVCYSTVCSKTIINGNSGQFDSHCENSNNACLNLRARLLEICLK